MIENMQRSSIPATQLAVVQQPQWMDKPDSIIGCPPGLECLVSLDKVQVRDHRGSFGPGINISTYHGFVIKNNLGQNCFFAYEEYQISKGNCRGFRMHLIDNFGQEVISFHRACNCCLGCCCCISGDTCADIVCVESPSGAIGRIVQLRTTCMCNKYAIQNANNETILVIEGPSVIVSSPTGPSVTFAVYTADMSQQIGELHRVRDIFGVTDFRIAFPMNLDVKAKVVMLSAVFLLEMMFFEIQNQ